MLFCAAPASSHGGSRVAGADEHAGNPACAAGLAPTELVVRIVRVAVPDHNWGSLPMGVSLVGTHERAGVLATIYLDRVAWVAAACGVDPLQLTGRAMAHEIGHLLLGTTAHARAGRMRALWSREEMQRPVAADWQFTRSDATKLRRAIEGRLKRTPGAGTAD